MFPSVCLAVASQSQGCGNALFAMFEGSVMSSGAVSLPRAGRQIQGCSC